MTLGDGSPLEGPAEGTVKLDMILPDGSTQNCRLKNVLYVPKLSYNLLSVSKASEARKTTKFDKCGCKIFEPAKESNCCCHQAWKSILPRALQKRAKCKCN